MICTPDLYYQEFKIQDQNLRSYKHKWLKRLDMYHELKFDEKEQVRVKADEFKKKKGLKIPEGVNNYGMKVVKHEKS